jgi:hypothetical protein
MAHRLSDEKTDKKLKDMGSPSRPDNLPQKHKMSCLFIKTGLNKQRTLGFFVIY